MPPLLDVDTAHTTSNRLHKAWNNAVNSKCMAHTLLLFKSYSYAMELLHAAVCICVFVYMCICAFTESSDSKPDLVSVLFSEYRSQIVLIGVVELLFYALSIAIPFLLKYLLLQLSSPSPNREAAVGYALGLSACTLLGSFAISNKFYHAYRLGSQVCTLITPYAHTHVYTHHAAFVCVVAIVVTCSYDQR